MSNSCRHHLEHKYIYLHFVQDSFSAFYHIQWRTWKQNSPTNREIRARVRGGGVKVAARKTKLAARKTGMGTPFTAMGSKREETRSFFPKGRATSRRSYQHRAPFLSLSIWHSGFSPLEARLQIVGGLTLPHQQFLCEKNKNPPPTQKESQRQQLFDAVAEG